MSNIKDLPRIDAYSCKFENQILEKEFTSFRLNKISRLLTFSYFFFSIIMLVDIYDFYFRIESFHPLMLINIFISISMLIIGLSKKDFKIKNYSNIFITVFIVYSTYQAYLFGILLPEVALSNSSSSGDIIFMPFMLILTLLVAPFNFLTSLVFAIMALIVNTPMLLAIPNLNPIYIFFGIVAPFVILAFNKWSGEKSKRLDYAKTISIDETKNLMQQTLKRYFGDVLSDKMLKDGGELEGEIKWVSVLFTDLSSYSTITENMSPEIALEFLNEYFTKMHEVIREFEGHILNYIGDSIMVVFGAPQKLNNHENKAVECSLKMKNQLKELNTQWDNNKLSRYWKNHGIDSIKMRTGIHTGSVIAGNIGSPEMIQYSTIGDTVNVASRLEQANKKFNTEISFSHEIYTALEEQLFEKSNLSGEITLKGRATPTKVYSI
tara:strand:- start:440 stop:1747 length:1308 start_codon:yes stop_codon:yes gene_type:complete